MNAVIEVQDLSKSFVTGGGETLQAMDHMELTVSENEFVCIVGPSGCGKSTLLRIMAGLEQAESGSVLYRGKKLSRPRRDVGMVFQEYSLLPWRRVLENVALGLEFSGVPKKERLKTARKYLKAVNMADFADAHPHELSGGMRQRVAIARALAGNPDLLLMDEPFGALDAHTRILLQKELLSIWETNRKTILFVTHSVDEALYLADRIVVISARPGRVREIIPVEMERPRNRAMPEYGRLTARILDLLEEEVMKTRHKSIETKE